MHIIIEILFIASIVIGLLWRVAVELAKVLLVLVVIIALFCFYPKVMISLFLGAIALLLLFVGVMELKEKIAARKKQKKNDAEQSTLQ